MDIEILNKILPNQIQGHIKKMIHHPVIGFIPEMHKWFNTYKSTNGINYINNSKIRNHVVTSIGTE